jgi:tripartite-type tricarboxylate transporter receptor subunit TctC
MMQIRPKFAAGASALVLALAAVTADAQEKFPSRPIDMVIPTAAGGGTDIAFRQLVDLVTPILGQKIVITNKTGGGGAVGMAQIIQAKPDGYTIGGLWNAPLTMTPHLQQPAAYQTKDYTSVSMITWAPALLCTKTAFPAKDGKEFIEELRRSPNKYTYGNDGVGGTLHLASERIFNKTGVKARAVPFNGAGETLKAFLGGHVDIYAGSIAPILPYVKDNSAKCLLLTSAERNAALPGASGLNDLGIGNEGTVLWRGVVAPNGIPADRLALLNKAFVEAVKSEKFRDFMDKRGEEARASTGDEMRQLIDQEFAAMGQVVVAVGLKK